MASPAAPAVPAREVPISKKDSPARRIYRVPDYINPEHEHFKAKELRLGLHTHVKLEGAMDSFKLEVARMVVRGTASASNSDPLASAEWAGFIEDLQLELEGAEATYEAAPEQDPPEPIKAKELRLGLHAHVKLEGAMDSFKLEVARMVVRGLDKTGTASASSSDPLASAELEGFMKDLELEGAEATYEAAPEQDPPELPHLPGSLLALDALFLCAYLRSILDLDCWGYRFRSIFRDDEFEARKSPLYRDMTIMGNQVPMSLLLAVIKQLGKAEASRKPNKPADDGVDAGETRKHDEGERLLGKRVKPGCCLLLHSNHMNNQVNGKTELAGKGGDKLEVAAKAMLNRLLMHVVAAVYPFTHGHKVKTWKQDLKDHLEMHHRPGIPDALCDCEHILAATYLAICGGFNPEPDEVVQPSLWRRFFCQGLQQGSDVEDHTIYRISSATSLKKCGIRFKAIDRPVGLDKMQFDNHSTLLLPKLVMNDHTAALFRNLALYEQMQQRNTTIARSDFRTYLYLMDSLMDEVEDVRLLIKSGVIVNKLGIRSDEDVCRQWNGMRQGLFNGYIPPKHMQELQQRIGDHVRAKHHQWIADFKERNCGSPVRFLAYVAASVVTVATALQAIMAVVAYFHGRSPSRHG